MTEPTPTRAYDLLETIEKTMVDEYVLFAVNEQKRKHERIDVALALPIPSEYIRRSRNALYRPLILAAIAEKIKEASDLEDISPTKVVKEHAAIAFSNLADFLEEAPFGDVKLKKLSGISSDKLGAIKTIETKPGPFGLSTKIVLHDKRASLDALSDMMGLVAPDKPPVLEGYVTTLGDKKNDALTDERDYVALLEHLDA